MQKNAKKSEKKQKKRKNKLEFRFALFASKQKLLNRSEAKNLKRKKCFALFPFEAKITQVKRSEKFEAKISEKKRKKRSEN
jgi:hypothetical protein